MMALFAQGKVEIFQHVATITAVCKCMFVQECVVVILWFFYLSIDCCTCLFNGAWGCSTLNDRLSHTEWQTLCEHEAAASKALPTHHHHTSC